MVYAPLAWIQERIIRPAYHRVYRPHIERVKTITSRVQREAKRYVPTVSYKRAAERRKKVVGILKRKTKKITGWQPPAITKYEAEIAKPPQLKPEASRWEAQLRTGEGALTNLTSFAQRKGWIAPGGVIQYPDTKEGRGFASQFTATQDTYQRRWTEGEKKYLTPEGYFKSEHIKEVPTPTGVEVQRSISGRYSLHPIVIEPAVKGIEWWQEKVSKPVRKMVKTGREYKPSPEELKAIEDYRGLFGLPPTTKVEEKLGYAKGEIAAGIVEAPPATLGLFGVLAPTATEMAVREPEMLAPYAIYEGKEMGKYAIEHPIEFGATIVAMGPLVKGVGKGAKYTYGKVPVPKPVRISGEGYKGIGIKGVKGDVYPVIGRKAGKTKIGSIKIDVPKERIVEKGVEYDIVKQVEIDAAKGVPKELGVTKKGLKALPEIEPRARVKLKTETVPERVLSDIERIKFELDPKTTVLPIEFERIGKKPILDISQEAGKGTLILERISKTDRMLSKGVKAPKKLREYRYDLRFEPEEVMKLGERKRMKIGEMETMPDVIKILERTRKRTKLKPEEFARVEAEQIKGKVIIEKPEAFTLKHARTATKEAIDAGERLSKLEKKAVKGAKEKTKPLSKLEAEILEDIKVEKIKVAEVGVAKPTPKKKVKTTQEIAREADKKSSMGDIWEREQGRIPELDERFISTMETGELSATGRIKGFKGDIRGITKERLKGYEYGKDAVAPKETIKKITHGETRWETRSSVQHGQVLELIERETGGKRHWKTADTAFEKELKGIQKTQRILRKRKKVVKEVYYESERAPKRFYKERGLDVSMPVVPVAPQITGLKPTTTATPKIDAMPKTQIRMRDALKDVLKGDSAVKDILKEIEKPIVEERAIYREDVKVVTTPIVREKPIEDIVQKERILERLREEPILRPRVKPRPIVTPKIRIREVPVLVPKKKKKDKKLKMLEDELEDVYRKRRYPTLTPEQMLEM